MADDQCSSMMFLQCDLIHRWVPAPSQWSLHNIRAQNLMMYGFMIYYEAILLLCPLVEWPRRY